MKGHISDSMNKIRAKRLAWMRKKVQEGWTQQQIGDHLGISRQRVQKILAKKDLRHFVRLHHEGRG
jgi:DNA-binding transcriptional regulator LsrR (DeoR family)